MFTNNFVTWFRTVTDSAQVAKRSLVLPTGADFPAPSYGTITSAYAYSWGGNNGNIRSDYSGTGIVFGTGNELPAMADYKLSGSIVAGLTSTYTKTVSDTDEYSRFTLNFTLTNTNAEEVTIREVGYIGECPFYNNNNRKYAYVLFWRELLESPITIPAGGVGQVSVNLDINLPYGA